MQIALRNTPKHAIFSFKMQKILGRGPLPTHTPAQAPPHPSAPMAPRSMRLFGACRPLKVLEPPLNAVQSNFLALADDVVLGGESVYPGLPAWRRAYLRALLSVENREISQLHSIVPGRLTSNFFIAMSLTDSAKALSK